MFDEIFEESGKKLMEVTESKIGIDFTAMSDDELLKVLYSRVSVQIFDMLEGDMQLFHMLLKNDSGKCLEKFRSIYVERSASFAIKYYDELYKRGIATRKLSERTVYMLSLTEFSMVCEIIADDSCQSGVTAEMKTAFMEAMNVLLHDIEAGLQIGGKTNGKRKLKRVLSRKLFFFHCTEESVPWRCIRETLMILTVRGYTTRSR